MNWQKYNLIDSEEKIKAVDEYLMDGDVNKFSVIAYDLETNGLELYKTSVVGFSFSVNDHQGFYLPLLVWEPDLSSLKTRSIDKVKHEVYTDGHLKCFWTGKIYNESVKPKDVEYPDFVPVFIERWFKSTNLIMWNAPFDINHTFINFGVDLKDNLLLDGGLTAHIENENESTALKERAKLYEEELGIKAYQNAGQEKIELKGSIIRNGGKSREVWRASLDYQSKYACADTFLTFGTTMVSMDRIRLEHRENYDQKIREWIFDHEVMPVCKDVVIDMKRRGVYIDVNHFYKLGEQNKQKMIELEDQFIGSIQEYLTDFSKGSSLDEAVSHQRLVKTIIALEGLSVPVLIDKKTGESKESIAKNVVKKEYEKNPHWIWAYILGEDEIKYSAERVLEIKHKLYREIEGRRYRFNLSSNDHLIWLFFDKLGNNRKEFEKTDGSTVEDWRPSLDADAIKERLLPKYDWVKYLLKYKKIQKIQSTYVQPALDLNIDGWLYMDFKQNGTTSGRFSCSGGFNLQTLPRVDDELDLLESCHKCGSKDVTLDEYIEVMANRQCNKCGFVEYDIVRPSTIKKGFIAPPGYKIVNADYASLEPRCFAYESKEEDIKTVYRDGLDLYSKVYCDIFDHEGQYSAHPDAPNFLKKVNKKARTFIKPLVLGIPYGAGDAQVANLSDKMIAYVDKEGITRHRPDTAEGKKIRDAYLNKYEKLQVYMLERELEAILQGYVDAKYGRRRHFKTTSMIANFIYDRLKLEYQRTSHDFVYTKKLVEHYEQTGTLSDLKFKGLCILESCYNFITFPRKITSSTGMSAQNDSGRMVMLTNEDLRVLAKELGQRYDQKDPGNSEPIVEKGCWSYIRNLLKADLNNAKNHPIQSLAGHITNMGMLETTRLFKQRNLDAWVMIQVHDEIGCYAKIEHAEMAAECLRLGMEENIYTLPLRQEVKMVAEPVICDNLKDSK